MFCLKRLNETKTKCDIKDIKIAVLQAMLKYAQEYQLFYFRLFQQVFSLFDLDMRTNKLLLHFVCDSSIITDRRLITIQQSLDLPSFHCPQFEQCSDFQF